MVHDAFKFDESLRLESPLNNVAQATHTMLAEGSKARQEHAAQNGAKLEKVKTAMKPYVFEHTPNECEMSVKVRVPPATAARDIKCHIARETIRLCVAGHALQVSPRHRTLLSQLPPASSPSDAPSRRPRWPLIGRALDDRTPTRAAGSQR